MLKRTTRPVTTTNSIALELRQRVLMLSFLSIAGVFIGLLLTFGVVLQQTQNRLEQINLQATQQFDLFFTDIQTSLLTNDHILTLGEHIDNHLLQLVSQNPAALDIAILNFDGTVITHKAESNRDDLIAQLHGDVVAAPPDFGEIYVGSVQFEGNKPVIDIATLATDEISLPAGILVARLDLTDLLEEILDVQVGRTGYAYITDETNSVISFKNIQVIQSTESLETLINQTPQTLSEAPLSGRFYRGLDGALVIGEARQLNSVPWFIMVEQPISEALVIFYWATAVSVLILLGLGLVLQRTVVFTQERIMQPLGELSTAVQSFSIGAHHDKIDLGTTDEFGQLGDTFNQMAEQIQDLLGNLEEKVANRTERLEGVAEISGQLNLIYSQDALLKELGTSLENQFGYIEANIFLRVDDELVLMNRDSPSVATRSTVPINHRRDLAARAVQKAQVVQRSFSDTSFLYLDGAEIAVPILSEGEVIGVLNVRTLKNQFDDADISFFNTLVNQVSIALNNAKLFKEIIEARREAEIANRAKTSFLSVVSHELKTPLNAILNFAEFIGDGIYGDVNEEQEEALQYIVNGGEHLLALLNDVLDISRIEAGTMYFDIRELDFNSVIAEMVAHTRILLQDKPIELITNIEEGLPAIEADKKRVRQILFNLVSNAVKYTDEGSITINTIYEDQFVKFSVEDTGVGIHEEDRELIFTTFGRGRHSSDKASSTGLGLAITKELVELQKGKISFQTEQNHGSIFSVDFPVFVPIPVE